jgi:hypothetical protein
VGAGGGEHLGTPKVDQPHEIPWGTPGGSRDPLGERGEGCWGANSMFSLRHFNPQRNLKKRKPNVLTSSEGESETIKNQKYVNLTF